MATLTSTSVFIPNEAPLAGGFDLDEPSISSPSTHLPPPWEVEEFFFSDRDTNSNLSVLCNGRLFVIHFSAENLANSPQIQAKYLLFLRVANDFDELDECTIDDFHDWAVAPLLPIFQQLAPADSPSVTSIEATLFPDLHEYTMYAASEKLLPSVHLGCQRKNHSEIYGVALEDQDCSAWRSFVPAEVQIFEEAIPGDSDPYQWSGKVLLLDRTVAFLKLVRRGDKSRLVTELKNYKTVADAGLDESLRISRLLGLVRDEGGSVFGLLLTYVDCGWQTLACVVETETPIPLRKKWASQVQTTVKQLHSAGVVWGDAKPDNVLIDKDENAWIVDFGGGYTEGWITKAMAETTQGDLDALKKILAFIDA